MIDFIKEEIAFREKCYIDKVRCSRCAHWGFNRGLVKYSSCGSRCIKRKEITYCNEYCRDFSLLKGAEF